MPDRDQAVQAFLAAHGWRPQHRSRLADDASFRSYDRLRDGQRRAVLMNAPPPQEDVRPFIQIANHLRGLGLSAPEIYAEDCDQGFLLLEDLGDATYTRVLKSTPAREPALYQLAVDVLVYLHKLPSAQLLPDGLAVFTTERLLAEVNLLIAWFVPQLSGAPLPPEAIVSYQALWRELFDFVQHQPQCLILRDFHVDNLLWLEGRTGLKSCGLLDFQDALVGATAYDLMSLLEDARRDIPDAVAGPLKQRYFAAFDDLANPGPARQAFEATYAILGAGRHAKVIGIFTRLCLRDGKADYLTHIPRVWRLLESSLRHPMLAALADWFDTYLPHSLRTAPAWPADEDR
ncbi:MAG: phosphotransferase [Rhodospirillales bacterium]|nr:phosphotransferase [Rhodospirillales bacterium]